MADAGVAEQLGHVAGVEDVGDEAVALVEIEAIFKGCGDSGSVLTAVLQHGQRIVDYLTDRLVSEDTDNATHRPSLLEHLLITPVPLFYFVLRRAAAPSMSERLRKSARDAGIPLQLSGDARVHLLDVYQKIHRLTIALPMGLTRKRSERCEPPGEIQAPVAARAS